MEEQMNQNQPQNDQPMGSNPMSSQEEPKMESNGGGSQHKAIAIIGYIIPILFFIPLLSEEGKKDQFAKFHANQHLLLFIAWILVNVLGSILPIIGWFIILPLGTIFLIVVAIMGIINAAKGEMKKMPLIGGFDIIK